MQDPSKPIWMDKEPKRVELTPNYHIFVGMPVHSEMSIHTAQSLLELQKLVFIRKDRITVQMMKSSLVTQGRNLCVSAFLTNKDATHLLFIDSDIGFEASSIYDMLAREKELISIPYPLKNINWEKIVRKIKKQNPNATKHAFAKTNTLVEKEGPIYNDFKPANKRVSRIIPKDFKDNLKA